MIRGIPFKIRTVRQTDRRALSLVFQACFSEEHFSEKWTLSAAQKRMDQVLGDPQGIGWVAVVWGHPIGFSFLQLRQGAREVYAELLETAVHPYFQNQGIERALLQNIKQYQKRKNIKNVMALVFRGKHQMFFQKNGWVASDRTRVYVSR